MLPISLNPKDPHFFLLSHLLQLANSSPMASLSPLSALNLSRDLRASSSTLKLPFLNDRQLRFVGDGRSSVRLNQFLVTSSSRQILDGETETGILLLKAQGELLKSKPPKNDRQIANNVLPRLVSLSCGITSWLSFIEVAESSEGVRTDMVYEIGELFELGIQLSYLLTLLGLLGVGTFFVIRQVLVRRELDLSAKELQEQVRSGDATATECFELGAVMLRRKFYPAAIKYLQQAIEKWDRDDQDLAQVFNALGVSYIRDNKLEKGIAQFEKAVKLQPGYVTAWNNLGDAYEKRKDLRAALKAFEEALLFDPNNKVARPRRDALRDRVQLYRGVPLKSEDR